MKNSRDLTVLYLRAISTEKKELRFLDGLSATGIRGIRIALESSEKFDKLTGLLNDKNPASYEFIKKNIELNRLNNVEASREKLNVLLERMRFDYIDIDPFGSPIEHLHSAFRALKTPGYIGITATDTAVLCGVHSKACLRIYHAKPLNSYLCHEIGLRILIGVCVLESARFSCNFEVQFAYYKDHYFRIFGKVIKSAECAYKNLSNVQEITVDVNGKKEIAGKLWTGGFLMRILFQKWSTMLKLKKSTRKIKTLIKFLEVINSEVKAPLLFYDMIESIIF